MTNMKPVVGFSLLLAAALIHGQAFNPSRAYQLKNLKTTKVSCGGHSFQSWIMDTENKKSEGLMFVTDKEMRADQGMLFLFQDVRIGKQYSFWMKNTLIPLDIVYIGKDKKLINVGVGKPKSEAQVMPTGPYFYVLELKGGTCKKLGLKPGMKFDISDSLKALE